MTANDLSLLTSKSVRGQKREIALNQPGNEFLHSKRDESGKCPVIKMNDLIFPDILITHFRNKIYNSHSMSDNI